GAAFQDTAARIASPAAANTPLRIDPSTRGPHQLQYFPLLRWLTQAPRKARQIGPSGCLIRLFYKSIVLGANISSSATRRAVRPCSWTYCVIVSSTLRLPLTP